MTPKQKEVLEEIKKFIKENGYSPTVRELCKIMCVSSPTTIHTHLTALKDKGYITYQEKKSRTIKVIE